MIKERKNKFSKYLLWIYSFIISNKKYGITDFKNGKLQSLYTDWLQTTFNNYSNYIRLYHATVFIFSCMQQSYDLYAAEISDHYRKELSDSKSP